jgi:hypothetical protein
MNKSMVLLSAAVVTVLCGISGIVAAMIPAVSDRVAPILFGLALIGIFVTLTLVPRSAAQHNGTSEPGYVCTSCHSRVMPKRVTPGSFALEVLLWLCFLLPGMLYTAWRISARKQICPVCKAPNPIPVSTPLGQQLISRA